MSANNFLFITKKDDMYVVQDMQNDFYDSNDNLIVFPPIAKTKTLQSAIHAGYEYRKNNEVEYGFEFSKNCFDKEKI